MDSIFQYICEHALYAPCIVFGLLLLTGLNIPISEDILIISAGVIATSCIPEYTFTILLFAYAGSIIAAWEAYWIGHYFGPKLYEIKWFKRYITPERIAKLHHFYERFGILSFMVIRFAPGGFRNGFAMTCGLSKMTFPSFLMRDAFAALFSVGTLFFIGNTFGKNSDLLFHYAKKYDLWALGVSILIIISIWTVIWFRKKTNSTNDDKHI